MTLLYLHCRCTSCGNIPPWRITYQEREDRKEKPSGQVVNTWQCKCGEVNLLTQEAYQLASRQRPPKPKVMA